jgi:hypothetical protein
VDLGVEHDVVLLVETSIVHDAHDVNGVFLVLPDPSGLHAFLHSLAPLP